MNGAGLLDPLPDDRRSLDLARNLNERDDLQKKFNDSFVTEKRNKGDIGGLLPAALRDDRLEKFSRNGTTQAATESRAKLAEMDSRFEN